MVAANYDFVRVWKIPEPVVEVENCLSCTTEESEVSTMDQQVARRNCKLSMQFMRV